MAHLWGTMNITFRIVMKVVLFGVTSKKVLARKGSRSVHEVGGASDHQYITVNVVGNAAGVRLPPFILYKGKNLYNT